MEYEVFDRKYRLKVGRKTGSLIYEMEPGAIPDESLRITFQVTHFAGGAFSLADITIYNASGARSRMLLGDRHGKYDFISLEAGYENQFGRIFSGQIINTQRVLDDGGVTKGVRFFCQSAAKEYAEKIINVTLSPEADPVEMIEACAEPYGKEMQFYGDFSGLPKRSRGSVFQGSPRSCLDNLAVAYGFKWMVEGDTIKFIKDGFAMTKQVTILNAETGMIGSPVVSDSEVGVRCVLNPKIILGSVLKIESMAPRFEFSGAFFNNIPRTIGQGYYQANAIVFTGDSHGDNWETQISCLRLGAAAQADIDKRARQ